MKVGEKIKIYMAENGIDNKSLASKMGIPESKLERILNYSDNRIMSSTYRNLVVALGVSADYFFEDEYQELSESEFIELYLKASDEVKQAVKELLENNQK